MLVLGIDPGTATTGYGFVRGVEDGPLAVAYGVILTPAGAAMPQRLLTIFRELRQLIALHRPDTGPAEKLFLQRYVSTAMRVGHAPGAAPLSLGHSTVPLAEYNPPH